MRVFRVRKATKTTTDIGLNIQGKLTPCLFARLFFLSINLLLFSLAIYSVQVNGLPSGCCSLAVYGCQ